MEEVYRNIIVFISGLVLISAMLMLVSIGMFAFPTRLPASRTPPKRADAKKPSLRGKP